MPLLGRLQTLSAMSVGEAVADTSLVVLDTRADRAAFMDAHLPGSLYAPATRQFTAAAGAFVEPSDSIVLLAAEDQLDELTRQLVRIGLDRMPGWIPVDAFDAWRAQGGVTASIVRTGFREADLPGEDSVWVDVRGAEEFAADHVPGAISDCPEPTGGRARPHPAGSSVTVHCATGGRAAMASAYLQRLGFDVRYVDDDFGRWRRWQGKSESSAESACRRDAGRLPDRARFSLLTQSRRRRRRPP